MFRAEAEARTKENKMADGNKGVREKAMTALLKETR